MDFPRERWDELAMIVAIFLVAIVVTQILTHGLPNLSLSPHGFAAGGAVHTVHP